MATISKHLFEEKCMYVDCDLMHPWHPSCLKAFPSTYIHSLIGSARFYTLVYAFQIMMRGKKMLKKEEWYKMGAYYGRSVFMGSLISALGSTLGCVFRLANFNKFRYHYFTLVPSTLTGLFIFLEPPERRGLVVNLFSNLVIEFWLRNLEKAGLFSITKSKQTIMFMTGSALLFYLMRLEGEKKRRTALFWMFSPEKVKKQTEKTDSACPHDGPCWKFIRNGALSYFGMGTVFTLIRLLLPNIRTPVKALSTVRGKHFKFALFLSSYIGIYRAVICMLCRKRGFDSALFALPAGYLAGLSFMFSPNLGFAIASLTGAFKLYSTILYENNLLPSNIPLPELLYCVCQGTLYHARFMHRDTCPNYVHNLMRVVTNGLIDQIDDKLLATIKGS